MYHHNLDVISADLFDYYGMARLRRTQASVGMLQFR